MSRLSADDLFKMHPNHPEITSGFRDNAEETCLSVNELLDAFEADGNFPLKLSPVTGTLLSLKNAGWRPSTVGGAPGSAHRTGSAVDLHDPEARLDTWIMNGLKTQDPETGRMEPDVLIEYDLYMEDPQATAGQVTKGGWCHLAIVKPKSGKRVFLP